MSYVEVLKTINESYKRDTSRWINEIIKVFKKGIMKFDYRGDSLGLSLLFDEIIVYRRNTSKKERNSIDKKLNSILDKLEDIINSKPGYISRDDVNYLEIEHIYNSLQELGLIKSKKRTRESHQINSFLQFIIFNSKDLNFIRRIITNYPDVINSVSDDGESLIEKITKMYLFNLSDFMKEKDIKYRNNMLFFDEVLKILLFDPDSKYEYKYEYQEKCLILLNDFLVENDPSYNPDYNYFVCRLIDNITLKKPKQTMVDLEVATDVHEAFSAPVTFIVKNNILSTYEEELEKRDHNDEYIMTLDCVGARVLDDGLSAKRLSNGNYLLGVHIADPVGYTGLKSPLVYEAYKRVKTIYTKNKAIHLFPDEFYEKAGLRPNGNNLVISYYLEIDRFGNILLNHFTMKKEVINVTDKFTYDRPIESLVLSSNDPRVEDTMECMLNITNLLKKRINIRNAFEEELLTYDECGSDVVQYAMVACNMTLAAYAKRANIPFDYIANGQKASYFERLKEIDPALLPDRDTRGFYKQLINNQGSSFYTTDPKQTHHTLGDIPYTRATSPLLIFGDLLSSIAVHAFIFGEVEPEDYEQAREDMTKMTRYMNHKVKSIGFYERGYSNINKD